MSVWGWIPVAAAVVTAVWWPSGTFRRWWTRLRRRRVISDFKVESRSGHGGVSAARFRMNVTATMWERRRVDRFLGIAVERGLLTPADMTNGMGRWGYAELGAAMKMSGAEAERLLDELRGILD